MSTIKSVSLSDKHAEMVKKEKLSLSAVLRTALDQVSLYKTGELLETTASLSAKIERLMDTINKQAKFIEERGLFNEFLEQKTE